MRFFDAHTHIHFATYRDDSREVIARALAAGVWLNTVGTQRDTSRRAVEIANQYPEGVYATVGLHPIHTSQSFHDPEELDTPGSENDNPKATPGLFYCSQEHWNKGFAGRGEEFDVEYYEQLARDSKVVAIGECGVDYYGSEERGAPSEGGSAFGGRREEQEKKERQKTAFIAQIKLAEKIKKPLMIHCRDGKKSGAGPAFDDLVNILKSSALSVPFISHSFVRDLELAKKLLDLGSHFSFNGIITFTHDYDEVIRYLPEDRILSETDAPYLAPVPRRGKRNEPVYVTEVVKKLAEIRGVTTEEIAELTFRNACWVFKVGSVEI